MSSNAEVIIYSVNKKEACLKRKGVDLEFNFSIKKKKKKLKQQQQQNQQDYIVYPKVWLGF